MPVRGRHWAGKRQCPAPALDPPFRGPKDPWPGGGGPGSETGQESPARSAEGRETGGTWTAQSLRKWSLPPTPH